jgi:hypothetical protein
MSKQIIADRKAEKKKAADQLAQRQKFAKTDAPSAKDARAMAEASGGKSLDSLVAEAWAGIMKLVKEQAEAGRGYAQVPAGPTTHPEIKSAIIKKLEANGYKHDLVNGSGYIYW